MSESTPNSYFDLHFAVIIRESTWKFGCSQMWMMLRVIVWRKASLITRVSAMQVEETWCWRVEPILISAYDWLEKIHTRPTFFESAFQTSSKLGRTVLDGRYVSCGGCRCGRRVTAKLMCSFPFLNADDSFEGCFLWRRKSVLEDKKISRGPKHPSKPRKGISGETKKRKVMPLVRCLKSHFWSQYLDLERKSEPTGRCSTSL